MPRINCSHCQKRITLRAGWAGAKMSCPFCRKSVLIDSAPVVAIVAESALEAGEPDGTDSEATAANVPLQDIVIPCECSAPAPVQAAPEQTAQLPAAVAPHTSLASSWFASTWPIASASVLLGLLMLTAGVGLFTNRKARQDRPGLENHEEQQEARNIKNTKTEPEKAFLEEWNRHRQAAGLSAVSLDRRLCEACLAHAKYLARNVAPAAATPVNAYSEDPEKPAYSAAGMQTAGVALVSYTEPMHALERWVGRLFARSQLLRPDLETVGVGFVQSDSGDWVCVIDPVHGRGNANADVQQPVLFPAADQGGVPRAGFDRIDEVKNGPVGFPVSVIFPEPTTLQGVEATLIDLAGKAVAIRISSPERPLNVNLQRAIIGLHPLEALQPDCAYTVEVAASVNGVPWRQRWHFTTGK